MSKYYQNLNADYSRPDLVSQQQGDLLIEKALEYIALKKDPCPLYDFLDESKKKIIEQENKDWWPTHCEALRRRQSAILGLEYRKDLVYFCQDGPFYGQDESTEVEDNWWTLLTQPGVTMCWPIVMFDGEIVYFEWYCLDDDTAETTAKGNVTFLRRGHEGAVYLKTEQLTFFRNVRA